MNFNNPVELSNSRKSIAIFFDWFVHVFFEPVFMILCYSFTLMISLLKVNYLSESPLVNFSSKIFGPCAAALSGFAGYIIALIIPHKYGFARAVFNLHADHIFRISITAVFLLLPITILLTKVIIKIFKSDLFRKYILITMFSLSLPLLNVINEFLNTLPNKSAFIFSFLLLGIVYYMVFSGVNNHHRAHIPRMRERFRQL